MKLVRGIGITGSTHTTKGDGKMLREYTTWQNMLHRCTKSYWDKCPHYTGVTCSENFKSYTFFYEWCNKQIGFNEKDENNKSWQLDKDILIRGNKLYSEDTCVFLPRTLNILLVNSVAKRGKYPLGVHFSSKYKKYVSQCCNGLGGTTFLGNFDNPLSAFKAYKDYKEALILEMVNKYKGLLDNRVYEALLQYEVRE